MSFDISAEEWKELRAEVLGLVEETRKLEILAVGASGAVYTWLATHVSPATNFGLLPWFIPVLFVLFGALRSWSLSKHIGVASDYLKALESELSQERSNVLGWELRFNKHRGITYWSAVIFWVTLLVITALIPFILPTFACVK